jgi:[protein-PII] uridylyltransferase
MPPTEVQALRDFVTEGRNKLLAIAPERVKGRQWMEEYSALIDDALRRIYRMAWDAARASQDSDGKVDETGLALLAIGGYGRGDLCPYSDIDIAFVTVEEENPLLDAVIKEAFRLIVEVLIDGAKLEVGYAYRPLSDIEHLDHTGKSALTEARLLAGGEGLLWRMRSELHRTWDAVQFLLDIAKERREIGQRLDLSLYAVEPNLKDGSGGLRDIHTVIWVTSAMLRNDGPLHELVWRGLVTADDIAQLQSAREFFLQLRVWSHLTTGKKTDVLRVEYQDDCARDFAFTGSGALAAQRLLREYYRHAERVSRVLERVLRSLLVGPLPLDGHFVADRRRLRAPHPFALKNHPELILSPFALAHKYGFTFDPELELAIEEALPFYDDQARRSEITRASFRALLQDPGDAARALTHLRSRGVLAALMPEFEALLLLAPADPSHQLTVGEHSLQAIRKLGEMWRERHDREDMFNIWSGVDDMEVLLLGTLLHDVGKIEPNTDHSISGERIAREIAERLGWSSERSERVALLVRRHLLLPRTARLRDLTSPGTLRQVMTYVTDVSTLKMLYLLSLADTRAVGERTYSQYDIEAMRELYEKTLLAMTREETAQALTDAEMREQLVQRERQALRREMRRVEGLAIDESTLHRLCEELPTSYVLNTPLPVMASHVQLLDQLPQEGFLVDFQDDEHGLLTEMTLVTYDDAKPGLLSKICGVMHALGVEILTAQVHTLRAPGYEARDEPGTPSGSEEQLALIPRQPDIVLDRLQLAVHGRSLGEAKKARLAASLRAVICDGKDVDELLRENSKETKFVIVPQRISARNDLSDEHTVLTVVSDNAPGLMLALTRGIASIGLDVHTAKITSWGGRAEDAFYVTYRAADGHASARGAKITDEAMSEVLSALKQKLLKP